MPKKNKADEVMIKLEGFLEAHRAELLIEEQGTGFLIQCGGLISKRKIAPAVPTRGSSWKSKKWTKTTT